jgi:hypothetical protein
MCVMYLFRFVDAPRTLLCNPYLDIQTWRIHDSYEFKHPHRIIVRIPFFCTLQTGDPRFAEALLRENSHVELRSDPVLEVSIYSVS